MLIRWTSLFFLAVGSLCSELPDNQFQTLNYGNIVEQLHDLATNYPHLAKVRQHPPVVVGLDTHEKVSPTLPLEQNCCRSGLLQFFVVIVGGPCIKCNIQEAALMQDTTPTSSPLEECLRSQELGDQS